MADGIYHGSYAVRPLGGDRGGPIRVLSWNIERGHDLAGVGDVIDRERPDLCILQEVDLNARRTGRRNIADLLAREFAFNYVFGVEFEELSQGSAADRAFHGQAVLARFQIAACHILRFRRQSNAWHPRWFLPQWAIFQPRYGGRMALIAELVVGRTRLVIYDVHLESQSDDNLRLWQLSQVVYDGLRFPGNTPIVVAGDMNTRIVPSPLARYLRDSGFRDAYNNGSYTSTTRRGHMLDWIFTRGPAVCSGTRIHQDVKSSDHYPVSTNLMLSV